MNPRRIQEMMNAISNISKKLGQAVFIELAIPFTASPFDAFVDAFLLGIKFETYYSYSQECIQALLFFLDDWAYL